MAIRINVTAVRDCPLVEVRAEVSEVVRVACAGPECAPLGDQLDVQEHGGWTWFITSVWGVSSSDLNRALCKLARPALQFTTSDGDRWYLTVHGGPRGQVPFLHEFSYHSHAPDPAEDAARQQQLDQRDEPPPKDPRLAFLEEDRAPDLDRPKVPFDLIADAVGEMGGSIPEDFRFAVAQLPYSVAVSRYREWHAEQVSSALADAGIPHDPAAVRSVLLWENLSEDERCGDLGNLPRLLSVLGFGGQWDELVRQAEMPPPPAEPAPEVEPVSLAPDLPSPPPVDHFGPVLEVIEPLGLYTVAGGPFALPLGDLTLTRFFVEALAIHATAGVVLTVTLPRGFDRTWLRAGTGRGVGTIELTPDGFRVGIDNHLWFNRRDLRNRLGKRMARVLYHLPNGSMVDVAFALPDRPALNQRYRGPVVAGKWQIQETYPPLTCEALAGGFDLAMRATEEPDKHELQDEDAVEAVVILAKRDPNLWDMQVQRAGRTVWCESDITGHLPKVIFRHRFAAHWDVLAHDREAERLFQERMNMQRRMREAAVEGARRRAAPHSDIVLFRGKVGPYWQSDFTRLDKLEQETREKTDVALAGLAIRHVGDLVAKKQRDIVMRAYASQDGLTFGCLLAKRTMYLGFQFHSRFADGSILSTTTNTAVDSQPQLKIYATTHPGLEPIALYEKHRWGIERFRARKLTEAVPLAATLLGVARELDRAMARRECVSLKIRILAPPPGEPPEYIRAAWVGCVLPLYTTTDDPKIRQQTTGVLSGRKGNLTPGFVVRVIDAIHELESHNAAAAQWWRQNAPELIQPGKLFIFPEEACELVDETDWSRG
jgi:hypothetical protein